MGHPLHPHRIGRFTIDDEARGPGATLAWHHHDAPLLSLVLQGAYEERYRCCAFSPRAFDVVVKPGGEGHADRVRESGARSLLVALPDDGGEMTLFANSVSAPRWANDHAIRYLTRRAAAEWSRRTADALAELALESILLEIVVRLARRESFESTPPWMTRVEGQIRDSFPRAVPLDDLAADCGVHPAHLARAFRKWKGCTVGDFVRALRVEAALRALTETDLPFGEVALASGFYDQSHMGRVLKSRLGVTPGQIRAGSRE